MYHTYLSFKERTIPKVDNNSSSQEKSQEMFVVCPQHARNMSIIDTDVN